MLIFIIGRSTENRTQVDWLKARCSTIELCSHFGRDGENRTHLRLRMKEVHYHSATSRVL